MTLDNFFLILMTPRLCLCVGSFSSSASEQQSRFEPLEQRHSSGHQVKFTPRSDSCVTGETRDAAGEGWVEWGGLGAPCEVTLPY